MGTGVKDCYMTVRTFNSVEKRTEEKNFSLDKTL